jgi:hypothetical protein
MCWTWIITIVDLVVYRIGKVYVITWKIRDSSFHYHHYASYATCCHLHDKGCVAWGLYDGSVLISYSFCISTPIMKLWNDDLCDLQLQIGGDKLAMGFTWSGTSMCCNVGYVVARVQSSYPLCFLGYVTSFSFVLQGAFQLTKTCYTTLDVEGIWAHYHQQLFKLAACM